MIATGFDRKPAGRGMSPAVTTPVDLSNYTAHLHARAAEAAAAGAGAQAHAGVQAAVPYGAPPLQVNRRPALDLSLPAAVNGGPMSPRSEGADFESPLDVPAFLRRQS